MIVGLEVQAEHVVTDLQITIAAKQDRFRHDRLHFLRHDADVSFLAAVVDEAIEAKAIAEAAKQGDVVLEPDVGMSAAAATSSTATTTTTAAANSRSATTAASSRSTATAAAAATTAEAGTAALRLRVGDAARLDVAQPALARHWPSCCATRSGAARARTVHTGIAAGSSGAVDAGVTGSAASARTIAPKIAEIPATGTGLQNRIAAAAAEIHAVLTSGAQSVVAKALLHIRVVIGNPATVRGIVLPVVAVAVEIIDVDRAIDVDVVVAPAETAAPVTARGPAPDRVANAESDAGGDDSPRDVSGWRKVIRRIGRIRPRSIDN